MRELACDYMAMEQGFVSQAAKSAGSGVARKLGEPTSSGWMPGEPSTFEDGAPNVKVRVPECLTHPDHLNYAGEQTTKPCTREETERMQCDT